MSKTYTLTPKEPLALFTQREDGVRQEKCFACGECGVVYATKESAHSCCLQQVCATCGSNTEKYWTYCSSCREQKMWDKAIEIKPEDHYGPVYDENSDRYFESYDEAVEYFSEDDSYDDDSYPEFLQPCKEIECPKLDHSQILENLTEDLFEDAYDHLKGVDKFKEACEDFNKLQTLKTWETDRSKKIKLVMPPKEEDNE